MKPFGLIDPSKVKPGSMQTISKEKLTTFVVGQQKKTRFQKEKEAREAKKKLELTEAAGLYEDFVASFDAGKNTSTFVRESSSRGDGGEQYSMQSSTAKKSSGKPMSEMERMLEEMKEHAANKGSSRYSSSSGGGGMHNVGSMSLGRGLSIPVIENKGSHDDGGGDSTNLYVGNLAPHTTEETLNEIFSKFGEIYSVKIMWPRTEEEKARRRNCGFVSFMQRGDAADALNAMNNADVEGHIIAVGWGKAIKKLSNNPTMLGQAGGFLKVREDALQPGLAPEVHDKLNNAVLAAKEAANNALKELMEANKLSSSGNSSSSVIPANVSLDALGSGGGPTVGAPLPEVPGKSSKWDISSAAGPSSMAVNTDANVASSTTCQQATQPATQPSSLQPATSQPIATMTDSDEKIEVVVPEDKEVKELIDRLARYISKDGQPLENMIREREASNEKYTCLNEPESKEALYYRWKVYSLCMGDKEEEWREDPFQITVDSPFYIPPKVPVRARSERSSSTGKTKGISMKEREEMRKERYKFSTGAQLEKARDRQEREKKEQSKADIARGRPLSERSYDKFQQKLRSLTCARSLIKEAMAFALDYADCSGDVVELLEGALLVEETPIPLKVARLHLLSDILYNSSAAVKHASTYRTLLQAALPKIMDHLNAMLRSPTLGRMSAKNLEEKVMVLLKVWEQWSIYPPVFLGGLEASIQRKQSDIDDDHLALQKGVMDGSSLDLDSLIRQAKYSGIYFDVKKDDAMSLFKKIAFAEEYIRMKESGTLNELPSDLASHSTSSELSPSVQFSNDAPSTQSEDLSANQSTSLLGSLATTTSSWQLGGTSLSLTSTTASALAAALDGSKLPGAKPTTAPLGQWATVNDEEEEEEEVDGEAMDDVDGVSLDDMSNNASKKRKTSSLDSDVFAAPRENKQAKSRFSDESENEEDDDVDGQAIDNDFFNNHTPNTNQTLAVDREAARAVEVEVLKYAELLETSKRYSSDEIEEMCSQKRTELLSSRPPYSN